MCHSMRSKCVYVRASVYVVKHWKKLIMYTQIPLPPSKQKIIVDSFTIHTIDSNHCHNRNSNAKFLVFSFFRLCFFDLCSCFYFCHSLREVEVSLTLYVCVRSCLFFFFFAHWWCCWWCAMCECMNMTSCASVYVSADLSNNT